MPSKPPTLPTTKPMTKLPPSPRSTHVPKQFMVRPWEDRNEGEKILIYGKSGIGKTTLAAMAPNPVFLGVDDGGRKIRHPVTGDLLNNVPGIDTFQDLRDAIQQPGLFQPGQSVIIDTITKVDELISTHLVNTIKIKNQAVSTFRQFGWDGDRYLLDQFRLLISDLDQLVRTGTNVVLLAQLAQITVANAEGTDYLEDGPKLQHRKDCSVRGELCEWSDHVCRIGYYDLVVTRENTSATVGKVIGGDATRAVFTGGAQHFMAKSRPVKHNRTTSVRIPHIVAFNDVTDDSLWRYIFGGADIPAA